MDGVDTVTYLVGRLQAGAATPSMLRCADRVMRRAEPAARAACRAQARGLPEAQVEELVQDTLERAWNGLHDFHPDGPAFEAWVRGIALNVVRNARRKKKRDMLTEDGIVEGTDSAQSVLRGLQRQERHKLVTTVIETAVQGVEQDVLYYRYCDDLSRERIAELLDLENADAVRAIIARASRRMRKAVLARLEELRRSQSSLLTSRDE